MLKNLMDAVLSPLPKRNSVPPQKYSPVQEIVRRRTRQTHNAASDVSRGQSGRGRGRPPKQSVVKSKLKATERKDKIQIKETDGGHVVTVMSKMLPTFLIPNMGKETTRSREEDINQDQHKDDTQRIDFNSDFNIHENISIQ